MNLSTDPMTTSQKNYLNVLLNDKQMLSVKRASFRAEVANPAINKGRASEIITELKTFAWMSHAEKAEMKATAEAMEAPKVPVVNGAGFYQGESNKIYSYLPHPKGNFKIWKMLVETNILKFNPENSQYEVVGKKGSYKKVYSGSAKKDIEAGGKKLTMEEVVAHGSLMGYCLCCGRTLTDPQSVANKIGPVCEKKYGHLLTMVMV